MANNEKERKALMFRIEEALMYDNTCPIIIERYSLNDWAVYFPEIDYSVRGTKEQIIAEISDMMREE